MDIEIEKECSRRGRLVDKWHEDLKTLRNDVRNLQNSVREKKNAIAILERQNQELDALQAGLDGVAEFTGTPGLVGDAISSAAIKYKQTANSIKISRLESEITDLENQNQRNELHLKDKLEDIASLTAWRRAHDCRL
jgi:hypothetical protein